MKNTTDILKKRLKYLGNERGKESVHTAGIAERERSWDSRRRCEELYSFFFGGGGAFVSHWYNVARFATLNCESYGNV